ncbi:isoprenoid synthase domain-containing protein [Xylaria scruposa]|nr:isoprenoid synthase domain-containing protein [Xylaria scruposa]
MTSADNETQRFPYISDGNMTEGINKVNGIKEHKSRTIHVPDLFGGILAGVPVENPLESTIGLASEEWTKKLINMDPKAAKVLTQANFAYLISLAAPQAGLFAFRMAVDWCIWAFIFDDQYDEGLMRDKTIESAHEIIWTLSLMDDTHPPVDPKTHPLRYMFQSTWHRFQERNPSPDLQQRWKESHRRCLYAILQQVWLAQSKTGLDISIQEYMKTRRQSIGSYCLFVVVEWAYGIKLTQDIFDHTSVSTCKRAAADLTWLVNDVLSYKKDLAFGVEHNIICLLMRKGYSEQEAMDKTGEMMNDCHKDWDNAVSNLPSWSEETDKEVRRYL